MGDGDASAEHWTDSVGRDLAPDHFWNSAMDEMISADNKGPCMGIKLNLWEQAKVGIRFILISLMLVMSIMSIVSCIYYVVWLDCIV